VGPNALWPTQPKFWVGHGPPGIRCSAPLPHGNKNHVSSKKVWNHSHKIKQTTSFAKCPHGLVLHADVPMQMYQKFEDQFLRGADEYYCDPLTQIIGGLEFIAHCTSYLYGPNCGCNRDLRLFCSPHITIRKTQSGFGKNCPCSVFGDSCRNLRQCLHLAQCFSSPVLPRRVS